MSRKNKLNWFDKAIRTLSSGESAQKPEKIEFSSHSAYLGSRPLTLANIFDLYHLVHINEGLRHARIGRITLKSK